MSHDDLAKELLKLADKIAKETDLGYQLKDILQRKFPLEVEARKQQQLKKLLEKLSAFFYTNGIYPDVGEEYPNYILTEMEILLIKIEQLAKELNIKFEVVGKIFEEESHKEGFFRANRFYGGNWNRFKEDLKLEDFYRFTFRNLPGGEF